MDTPSYSNLIKDRKKFTLKVHQSNFSAESLVINAKDLLDIKGGDIVKIFSCDGDPSNHLVIKVKYPEKEELQKNTVSIEQTLAHQFNLHAFQSVYVVKVEPADISLDLVEVMFKEQYVSRSDMWRLKRHLVGSCTCVNTKVEFCDIRAQVNELWINGSKVKCGLVTDSTRIVLRSATALVYIFIQMSHEMWDFDAYGQLQFEKAVNGFLKDLFSKWKEKCYHEFTLVIFSRSFYTVSKLDQFPGEIRDVVKKDHRGRFYIDFYYCVAHHERSEDCSPLLSRLKKLFSGYKSLVEIPDCPPGVNSSASEGNFLEAINMSLDVFEKHYIDRNFDRTGQLVLCITPGVGVFDVDRELTILTKERMIDNGIGSDLVCLGQEPLHTVPLFKFHHRTSEHSEREMPHSFNIPHWINYSFYSPNPFLDKGTVGIKHVPRVTFSLKKERFVGKRSIQSPVKNENFLQPDLPSLLTHNIEEFDDEIFGSPRTTYRHQFQKKTPTQFDRQHSSETRKFANSRIRTSRPVAFPGSSPLRIPQLANTGINPRAASSVGHASNLDKYFTIKEEKETDKLLVGSAHSFRANSSKKMRVPQRALINPFITLNTMQPVTSNRRRWVHTYPNPQPSYDDGRRLSERLSESSDLCDEDLSCDIEIPVRNTSTSKSSQSIAGSANSSELSSSDIGFFGNLVELPDGIGQKRGFPWSPCNYLSLGKGIVLWKMFCFSLAVNWKSLRSPACLPITNDYFPSKLRLNNEYTEQSYNLIPDHDDGPFDGQTSDNLLNIEVDQGANYQSPQQMKTREVFLELVNQRLCQGFQLVVSGLPKRRTNYYSSNMFSGCRSSGSLRKDTSFTSTEGSSPIYPQSCGLIASPESAEAYTLNHGRQYHVVSLTGENEILVEIYKPRHPFLTSTIEYKYLLWAVGRDRFRVANVKFTHEQYESYHWSYQDNCVCCGGADSEFKITDSIKYWRAKFFIIPSPLSKLRQQKAEIESACDEGRNPRYDLFSLNEHPGANIRGILDGMLKFFDHINKVRRTPTATAFQRDLPQRLMKDPSLHPSAPTNMLPSSVPVTHSQKIHTVQFSTVGSLNAGTDLLSSDVPEQLDNFGKAQNTLNTVENQEKSHPGEEGSGTASEDKKAHENGVRAKRVFHAMHDEKYGFTFLQHQGRLPNKSFLSADAVHWCLNQDFGITDIEDAVGLFEHLHQMKYICHASWDFNHQFLFGYYIFHILPETSSDNESDCNRNFQSEWLELEVQLKETFPGVEFQRTSHDKKKKSVLSTQLERDSTTHCQGCVGLSNMKTVLIPLSNKHKTGRTEWCQIQHPASIVPWRGSTTFTFNVQWMVATATCLCEMLLSWLREANRCSLYMLPSPNNPFAFPHTEKDASPLHCPLFVSLNLVMLFEELPNFEGLVAGETLECRKRIIDFMGNVAIRFGFQRYYSAIDHDAERNNTVNSLHFVHYTGQVFLEIPVTRELKVQGRTVATRRQFSCLFHGQNAELTTSKPADGKLDIDIATGGLSKRRNSMVNLKDCGFYFSVNHMLTKRWRHSAYEDCPTNELEADFIEFCSNSDGRLATFYTSLYS